jgi:dipeptidyl aminopeptidase/acylaminoacyl peptidase
MALAQKAEEQIIPMEDTDMNETKLSIALCILCSFLPFGLRAESNQASPLGGLTTETIGYSYGSENVKKAESGNLVFVGVDNLKMQTRNAFYYTKENGRVTAVFPMKHPRTGEERMPGVNAYFDLDRQGDNAVFSISYISDQPQVDDHFVHVNLKTGERRFIVEDGQCKFSPSISPDGEYIAFYSTDPRIGFLTGKDFLHEEGKVCSLKTGEVKTYKPGRMEQYPFIDPLPPPVWLDNERVAFAHGYDDKPKYDKLGRQITPSGKYVYFTVAYPPKGNAVIRYYSGESTFRCLPDTQRARVLFYNDDRVIQFQWDLTGEKELIHADSGQRVYFSEMKDDGTLILTSAPSSPASGIPQVRHHVMIDAEGKITKTVIPPQPWETTNQR